MTATRTVRWAVAAVIATMAALLGAFAAGAASATNTAATPPGLACTGGIDPTVGGTLTCTPTSPSPLLSGSGSTTPTPAPTVSPRTSAPALTYTSFRVTGYGARDNDCSGGGGDCTAWGDGHAGGTGTWDSPISVAVQKLNGKPIYPVGTRFYAPFLRRYLAVEDWCGACKGAWLDVWVDGRAGSAGAASACMNAITGRHSVIVDPPPGLPVDAGVIASAAGCDTRYGETV